MRAIQAAISEIANNTQRFANDSVDADSSGAPDGVDIEFDTDITINGGSDKANNRDIKFYLVLPIDAANEATSDADARFIECNVFPRTATFAFAAVVGAVTSASPSARAVAGWASPYCDGPPVRMCNPDAPLVLGRLGSSSSAQSSRIPRATRTTSAKGAPLGSRSRMHQSGRPRFDTRLDQTCRGIVPMLTM